MNLLRRWLHALDDAPPGLRGVIGGLSVLVAVLWPLLVLPEGTHPVVHAVLAVVTVVLLFAMAEYLLRRFHPGVRR